MEKQDLQYLLILFHLFLWIKIIKKGSRNYVNGNDDDDDIYYIQLFVMTDDDKIWKKNTINFNCGEHFVLIKQMKKINKYKSFPIAS